MRGEGCNIQDPASASTNDQRLTTNDLRPTTNDLRPLLHLLLHLAIPLLVARLCYPGRWRFAAFVMLATMIVDADHLLARPIYDPARCSIGFHPLHTTAPIIFYGILAVVPLIVGQRTVGTRHRRTVDVLHLVGVGLLIHMALDAIDCVI